MAFSGSPRVRAGARVGRNRDSAALQRVGWKRTHPNSSSTERKIRGTAASRRTNYCLHWNGFRFPSRWETGQARQARRSQIAAKSPCHPAFNRSEPDMRLPASGSSRESPASSPTRRPWPCDPKCGQRAAFHQEFEPVPPPKLRPLATSPEAAQPFAPIIPAETPQGRTIVRPARWPYRQKNRSGPSKRAESSGAGLNRIPSITLRESVLRSRTIQPSLGTHSLTTARSASARPFAGGRPDAHTVLERLPSKPRQAPYGGGSHHGMDQDCSRLVERPLRIPCQANLECIQMCPGKESPVLEHADDNAGGDTLFLGERTDDMRASR